MHADSFNESTSETKPHVGRLNRWMASFIQRHPAASFFGALTLGYLVARFARREY
jgi:hypothetical protein